MNLNQSDQQNNPFHFQKQFLFQVYAIITLLPWSRLRERLALPTKKNFYYYVAILSGLNGIQCVGSGLLLYRVTECGLCIVDVTTLLYYTLLTPFVYYTFLSDFFRWLSSYIITLLKVVK